ncbi:hypothetical protein ACHAXR_009737 [Thalassiosira sp. AJA248-18]
MPAEKTDGETLDGLLTDEFKTSLNNIKTHCQAKKFYEDFGFLFIQQAYLGGSFIETSNSSSTSAGRNFKSKLSVGSGADAEKTLSSNQETSLNKTSTKIIGGDTSLDTFDDWIKTFDTEHRATIVECKFKPIYELAKDKTSHDHLEEVYEQFFMPIEHLHQYKIENRAHGQVYFGQASPKKVECGQSKPQAELRLWKEGDSMMARFKCQDKVADAEFEGQQWPCQFWPLMFCGCDGEGREEGKKRDVFVLSGGGGGEADGERVVGDTKYGNGVAPEGESAFYYFGRTSPFWKESEVAMSNNGKSSNSNITWLLEPVEENTFLICTSNGERVLGLDEVLNGKEQKYKYVLTKRSKSNPSELDNSFKWKFTEATVSDQCVQEGFHEEKDASKDDTGPIELFSQGEASADGQSTIDRSEEEKLTVVKENGNMLQLVDNVRQLLASVKQNGLALNDASEHTKQQYEQPQQQQQQGQGQQQGYGGQPAQSQPTQQLQQQQQQSQEAASSESASSPTTSAGADQSKESTADPSVAATTATDDSSNNSNNALPEPWQEHNDPTSGRSYYYNPENIVTQWERPLSPSTAAGGGVAETSDRQFVLVAVEQNGEALEYASEELRGDRDVVLAAVKETGGALQFASDDLRGNRCVVLAAIKQNGSAFRFASDDLKVDRDIALASVEQDGLALRYASKDFKCEREFVLAAVKQNGLALEYASKDLKGDRQVVLAAANVNGCALQYASEDLRGDHDVVLAAVKQDGYALEYASEYLKGQREMLLCAMTWSVRRGMMKNVLVRQAS